MLLEGTYPYVRGGVSSWVHQILSGLPELTFSLVFVGGRRSDYGQAKYELPKNVVELQTHYLEDAFAGVTPKAARMPAQCLRHVQKLHDYLKTQSDQPETRDASVAIDGLLSTLEQRGGLTVEQFLFSEGAWSFIRKAHLSSEETPFIDYFWTLRLMHGPIFQLARIAAGAPRARIYHTVSTGYAGLLGAMLERRHKRPLVLSEHGIYTKERRIDLNQAEWLDSLHGPQGFGLGDSSAVIRSLWIRYFEGLGRLTYRSASPIISLYAGNRARQLEDGADAEHTRIIVNGIDVQRFAPALAAREPKPPHVIGLIGRVVPIKDVKTFIRAMRRVKAELTNVEGWIIGSSEEDAAYGQECEALVRSLGLQNTVRFLGHQNVADILPKLGLLMLTSISEAQPLAILEAFAAGVPCVATDVGACREQVEGRTAEDRALGAAGRVVPFADANALGDAAVELLSHDETWRSCQRAGLARVSAYYAQASMLDSYRAVYREALAA
jgi:glycosyltransferase involved in cell wall biosynthesis